MKKILALLFLVAFAVACGGDSTPPPQPTPVPEPTMVPSPVPPATPCAQVPGPGPRFTYKGDCAESPTCVRNADGTYSGTECHNR